MTTAPGLVSRCVFSLVCGIFTLAAAPQTAAAESPNIIWIMADDLGYGDLGCYGQKLIQTPRLDRMAAEGARFTSAYAGSTVCAPSRCVLMTGLHTGHCHVRGNAGGDMQTQSLRPQDLTVAELLKKAGYATALCGKWGLGHVGATGRPNEKGFDYFYGYLNQVHAHNYYPEFLWRNEEKHLLRNVVQGTGRTYGGFEGGWATRRIDYTHDLIAAEAHAWVKRQIDADQPFFLYLALTIPHANNEGTRGTGNGQEVPDYGIYADKDWPDPDKGQAAMVTRMDGDVGKLLDLLRLTKADKNTLVIFTSDNGPHNEGGHNPKRFSPSGPLRGMKRDLYEGGVRVPTIAWWPGTIKPGQVIDTPWWFADLLPTAADLSGTTQLLPKQLDGISIVPLLKGGGDLPTAPGGRTFFWEFYEQGGKRAVRRGNWKLVQMKLNTDKPVTELYDLSKDIGETNNIAADHPKVVADLLAIADAEHVDHPNWRMPGR